MTTGPSITLAELTLNMARRDIGTEEEPHGSNAGPRVNQYHATTHSKPGDAWCAAAACTWIQEAANSLGIRHVFNFSAGALRLLELNTELIIEDPEVGCLVIWRHANGKGHVGVCESWTEDQITYISGNTNSQGGREGFEVARRTAWRDENIEGFIRVA